MNETTYCATHPSVESTLRCSRCEKYICPRCMVYTPVGARCRECARVRKSPVFDARPRDLWRGLGAGLGVGLLGGALISTPLLSFFTFFFTLGVGFFVGRAVSAAANRRRATSLAVVAVISTVIGLVFGPLVLLLLQAPDLLSPSLLMRAVMGAAFNPFRLLAVALAALIAWYQVR